ncbi:unannotated protein [freshwater metagenome]|uniref:Unannotated protein n=1 Tax=freshwater metagenome TaxID=449393 RepID=A0A6J7JE10_9ZZZZ
MLDEVQTGIGRTGTWFAHQSEGVTADVVTLAKGLGGGLPIGAMVALGGAAELFTPGSHGSTFGGNPVSCAAALAVLDTIEAEGLLERAGALGARLATELAAHPQVSHVRGRGLMLGVVLTSPIAKSVEAEARARGVLINATGPSVIRLVPPLVLTDADVDLLLHRWPTIIDAAAALVSS